MDRPEKKRSLSDRFPALSRLGAGLGRARRRVPVIRQITPTECGAACLAMVLGYYGKEVPRDEVRVLLGVGRGGTNARDLLNGARHHGLRGRGVRLSLEAIEHLPPAAILHWGLNHFVIFEGLARSGVDIVDPAVGRRHVPMDEFRRSFTGVALLLDPSDRFEPTSGGRRSDRYFGRLLWRSGEWARILSISAFLQLLTLVLPLLTGAVIDRVVPRADLNLLLVLSIAVVTLIAFQLLASMIRGHLLLRMRTLLDAGMTLGFVGHLVSLPYIFFQQRPAGDLLMRINSNNFIREVLSSSALSGLIDGLMMSVYVVLLLSLNVKIGAVVFAIAALQVAVFLITRGRQRELNAQSLARQAKAQSYQVEMLHGIETLKAMGCEDRAEEHWSNLFIDVLNASLAYGRLNVVIDSLSSTLRMTAPLIVIGLGALMVIDGEISLGTMIALNTFAVGVFAPLASLVSTVTQLQLLGSYIERIKDVQDSPPEQDEHKGRLAGPLRGRVALEQVSFRYGPIDPLVVKDVSLAIEPGQLVAIVGRSGSGKSTLASLLIGLYAPTSGKILYDGVDLVELDLRSVRRQIGIVTQRAYLFGATVRANIALADPSLPIEAIIEAAGTAQVHDEIAEMAMAYDTPLIDGGASLSGGQRQRIALARALVRKPAILLLDEATSALDAITERKVQLALASLRCTRIVIAHRLSTIMDADAILVMDGGQLVERGKHHELLARGGVYAQLVATQLAEGAWRDGVMTPSPAPGSRDD